MIKKQVGLSMAVLALTSQSIDCMRVNQLRTQEDELENDNGDDYMAESIAEAEKEVKEKKGSIDMQKEIKQLEEDSEVKTVKPSEDMDASQKKQTNKMTDDLTAEALESKSVLEYNGKEFDVKQDKEAQEHANFLNVNKQAIHEAYLDIKSQLGSKEPKPEEQGEVKVEKKKSLTHDDKNLSQKKTNDKSQEESGSESDSESQSDSEDDGNKKKKKKKNKKKKKSKKGKKEKNAQVNKTSSANTTQPVVANNTQPAASLVQKDIGANKTVAINKPVVANQTIASNQTINTNKTNLANTTVNKSASSNVSIATNKTALSQKYSLVDQFVQQYTAPTEHEKEKEHSQKKEHKKHHKHEHKEGKKHHHKHHKHTDKKDEEKTSDDNKPDDKKSFVQLKDFDDDEDKDILESIKFAEHKLGSKMGTPHALPKEHAYAPVKYDVEETDFKLFQKEKKVPAVGAHEAVLGECEIDDQECIKNSKVAPADDQKVQLKDWDQDEDKEIMESIKFAENKLGAKMGTPKVVPGAHAHAPITYDVESLSQSDSKSTKKALENIEKNSGAEAGVCEVEDTECRKRAVGEAKKPSDEATIQTHSHMHYAPEMSHTQISDDKKDEKKDEKKEEKKEDKKAEKKDEKVEQKKHDEKIKDLKPLLNDPKEVEQIKKDIKEQVEKDMKIEMAKKMDEVRRQTEQEILDKIAQEGQEKKQKQESLKDAEEAADEAKQVAEKKAALEEQRKLEKAEGKKEALRLAIRRQADEILAKDEFKQKLVKAAHKYNLHQTRQTAYDESSDSDSDSD